VKYTMTNPCPHCPFRYDVPAYLKQERAEEIIEAIVDRQGYFPCHETTVESGEDDGYELTTTPNSQHCAGAMIMLEHMEMPNQLMRIMERLGMYDRRKLNMGAPVFEDAEQFIEHHDL
jgi:hypothetical protein